MEKTTQKKQQANLNAAEILQLIEDIKTLRSCPGIPFKKSIELNSNIIPLSECIKKNQDSLQVLREQFAQHEAEKHTEEERNNYMAEFQNHYQELRAERFEFEPIQVELSTLDIEISGSKELETERGIKQYGYRDAYFNLVLAKIII